MRSVSGARRSAARWRDSSRNSGGVSAGSWARRSRVTADMSAVCGVQARMAREPTKETNAGAGRRCVLLAWGGGGR